MSPLHGTGVLVGATSFNIKVLHQGHTAKEGRAAGRLREELGDAAKWLKDTVLTLQRISGGWGTLFDRELKEQVDCITVLVEKTLQPPTECLHAGCLDH